MRRSFLLAAVAASAVLALAGCTADSVAPSETLIVTDEPATGELTIYAAASLKASFDEIADEFERDNPDVDVRPIVYDGSSTLVTQLTEGAPADVFASADENNMTKASNAGLVGPATLFASNTLVIAVPKGNPGRVRSLADLEKPGLSVVLCAAEVPCGAASATLLKNADVTVKPASYEQNVTAVLTKVGAGEADAGLVYATDVKDDPSVESIVPAGADEVVNRYPIATLKSTKNPDSADAFVDFVLGDAGQAILRAHGFGAP
jgi:molybdate transport system substrate-binding protein